MKEPEISNPFIVGKYLSDKYFCDRSKETDYLRKQIDNGRDVALISPRRLGKTGLIQHLFNQEDIKDRYYVFFVDIYATTSLAEFVYILGKEIYEQLKPQTTVWKEKFFQMITSFRVGFKLDTMTGAPSFDLGLGDIQAPQTTLDEIFAYIDEADRPCIIAIDEFQQICREKCRGALAYKDSKMPTGSFHFFRQQTPYHEQYVQFPIKAILPKRHQYGTGTYTYLYI